MSRVSALHCGIFLPVGIRALSHVFLHSFSSVVVARELVVIFHQSISDLPFNGPFGVTCPESL